MRKKTSQSGRSMVEMLGVIAIIGLITVAGITSMGYVDSYFRSSATVIEIDNLAKDVLDTYSWSRDFSSLDMTFICSEGILKCTDGEGEKCGRYTFSYEPEAGVGHFIHTYMHDGDPIPSFEGEPERVIIGSDIDAFTEEIWDSLDNDNRVSLYVRYICLNDHSVEEKIINSNE